MGQTAERLYRSKWVQSITVNDVMESGQVVENPMIGAIPISENILLPDLAKQSESIEQQSGEIAERGMPT